MANEQKIWNYLKSIGCTNAGAAAMMGNLKAESGLIPNRLEVLCRKRLLEHTGVNWSDEEYTKAVDDGRITRAQFLNPLPNKKYGYGICQWTTTQRKSGLYDLAKSKGVSIGDLDTQLVQVAYNQINVFLNLYNQQLLNLRHIQLSLPPL